MARQAARRARLCVQTCRVRASGALPSPRQRIKARHNVHLPRTARRPQAEDVARREADAAGGRVGANSYDWTQETWEKLGIVAASFAAGAGCFSIAGPIGAGVCAGAVGGALSAAVAGRGVGDILLAGAFGAAIGGASAQIGVLASLGTFSATTNPYVHATVAASSSAAVNIGIQTVKGGGIDWGQVGVQAGMSGVQAYYRAAAVEAGMAGRASGATAHAASRMDHGRMARDSGISMFGGGYGGRAVGEMGATGDPWMAVFGPTGTEPGRVAPAAVSAWGEGSRTIIAYDDGSQQVRIADTRAWRNNNPGNLRQTGFSQRQGSLGAAGGFAVFPDSRAGADALVQLLNTDTYQGLTVNQAIDRFAPAFENNTAGYQSVVRNGLGVSGNVAMSSLTSAQIQDLAWVIAGVEGWYAPPGRVEWR